MNDLRYAFRQLLKNPGFTAVRSDSKKQRDDTGLMRPSHTARCDRRAEQLDRQHCVPASLSKALAPVGAVERLDRRCEGSGMDVDYCIKADSPAYRDADVDAGKIPAARDQPTVE